MGKASSFCCINKNVNIMKVVAPPIKFGIIKRWASSVARGIVLRGVLRAGTGRRPRTIQTTRITRTSTTATLTTTTSTTTIKRFVSVRVSLY